uniref:Uncharacterized protein n=1 Tax=Picea glauca TaxID=3330 RepID=A0A117NGL1_PICGL|nr:hypothetical protein ABT39_MTgene5974 [Picea glauca]QHR88496.1 hypothetical protein Q903MT_gene2510 [Picea sitchensis]
MEYLDMHRYRAITRITPVSNIQLNTLCRQGMKSNKNNTINIVYLYYIQSRRSTHPAITFYATLIKLLLSMLLLLDHPLLLLGITRIIR